MSKVPLGAAVRWDRVSDSPGYARFYLSHYSWLTPENELKMNSLSPSAGKFDFALADRMVDWARGHGKSVHGHALVWGQELPSWLSSLDASVHHASRASVRRILDEYIRTVMTHFRGRVPEWDVVNEAFDQSGSWLPNLWLHLLGPGYAEEAFRVARATDPHVRLCYNDLGIEVPGPHADAVLALIRRLRRERLIDCVGFELHTRVPGPSGRLLALQMRRFASTGADVLVSELDVSLMGVGVPEASRRAAQAGVYSTVAGACSQLAACRRITTWGFTDASTWLRSSAEPLPFDNRCRAKPAWLALKSVLTR